MCSLFIITVICEVGTIIFSTLEMKKISWRGRNHLAKVSWQSQDYTKPPRPSPHQKKPHPTKQTNVFIKMYWIPVLCKIPQGMYPHYPCTSYSSENNQEHWREVLFCIWLAITISLARNILYYMKEYDCVHQKTFQLFCTRYSNFIIWHKMWMLSFINSQIQMQMQIKKYNGKPNSRFSLSVFC